MVFISRCSLIGGIKYGKTWEQLAAEQVVGISCGQKTF